MEALLEEAKEYHRLAEKILKESEEQKSGGFKKKLEEWKYKFKNLRKLAVDREQDDGAHYPEQEGPSTEYIPLADPEPVDPNIPVLDTSLLVEIEECIEFVSSQIMYVTREFYCRSPLFSTTILGVFNLFLFLIWYLIVYGPSQ